MTQFTTKLSDFFVYADAFEAVLGDGATLANAVEVLTVIQHIAPIFQEARLRAQRIVEARGPDSVTAKTMTAEQYGVVAKTLGDDAKPRAIPETQEVAAV